MDTPRIALRFRDVHDAVDTIRAHQSVIDKQGAVWWGWWKKHWEPDFSSTFSQLAGAAPGTILLIDRSTERAFNARFLQATQEFVNIDWHRIPEYYRNEASGVSGWFLLEEVREVSFDHAVGRRLGETTFLILDGAEATKGKPASTPTVPTTHGRDHILHLSDLHFGSDYAFLPTGEPVQIGASLETLTKCLTEDLSRLGLSDKIGAIIASGDFTTRGDWSDKTKGQILEEFSNLLKSLRLNKEHLLVAPGNHDIQRFPEGRSVDVAQLAVSKQTTMEHETQYRLFQEQLTGRPWGDPLNYSAWFDVAGVEVCFAMLNSCAITATKWTEYGFVSTGGFDVLRAIAENRSSTKPVVAVMVLHHHLLPVSAVETPESRGVSVTLNAIDLMDVASTVGVSIALHGHQHMPRVSSYTRLPFDEERESAPITIISGGSTGASRRPGAERNTYSLLRISSSDIAVSIRELRPDAKPGKTLFQRSIPVRATHGAVAG